MAQGHTRILAGNPGKMEGKQWKFRPTAINSAEIQSKWCQNKSEMASSHTHMNVNKVESPPQKNSGTPQTRPCKSRLSKTQHGIRRHWRFSFIFIQRLNNRRGCSIPTPTTFDLTQCSTFYVFVRVARSNRDCAINLMPQTAVLGKT